MDTPFLHRVVTIPVSSLQRDDYTHGRGIVFIFLWLANNISCFSIAREAEFLHFCHCFFHHWHWSCLGEQSSQGVFCVSEMMKNDAPQKNKSPRCRQECYLCLLHSTWSNGTGLTQRQLLVCRNIWTYVLPSAIKNSACCWSQMRCRPSSWENHLLTYEEPLCSIIFRHRPILGTLKDQSSAQGFTLGKYLNIPRL